MMAGSLYRGSSKGALDDLVEKPFNGAGKGGTTHDFGDCWFLGYNKRVTCGVWTGFLLANGEPIYPGAFSRDLAHAGLAGRDECRGAVLRRWQAAITPSRRGRGRFRLLRLRPARHPVLPGICRRIPAPARALALHRRARSTSAGARRNSPFCTVHSGASADGGSPDITLILNLPALDAVPVRPKAPVLFGDDPYHTELPEFRGDSAEDRIRPPPHQRASTASTSVTSRRPSR